MSISTVAVTVPAQGLGPTADVSSIIGQKTVQLSGVFRGYYELLGSQDGANYVGIATFDSGGPEGIQVTIDGAIQSVRINANVTSSSGVTCHVLGISGTGVNGFGTIATLAAGASGLTPPVDTATFLAPSGSEGDTCLLCSGDFEGTLVVLGSSDGVEYNPVGEFRVARRPEGSPSDVSLPPLLVAAKVRYFRLRVDAVVSGATVVTLGGRVPLTPPSYALTDLSNLIPTEINQSLVPGTPGTINLGSQDEPWQLLVLSGSSLNPAANHFILGGAATAERSISLPDASGTLLINSLTILPTVTDALDIGVPNTRWRNLYMSGLARIDRGLYASGLVAPGDQAQIAATGHVGSHNSGMHFGYDNAANYGEIQYGWNGSESGAFSFYYSNVGGTPVLLVTIRSNGFMGINTSVPTQALHVVGGARISTLAGVGTRAVVADANGVLSAP